MEVEVNYWAVLLAALSTMVVGSIWYSKGVFGNLWAKLARVNLNRKVTGSEMFILMSSAFVASAVTAYVMAHVTFLSHNFFGNSWMQDSLTTAFWLWLGLVATRLYVHDAFENRRKKLTLLNVAHELVTILVMGAIIGFFPV